MNLPIPERHPIPEASMTIVPVEYLYGSWQRENADGYLVQEVVPFRIKKKTAKRIFYYSDDGHADRYRSVDRAELEATGSVYNRSRGWWSPDYHLFADRADVEPAPPESAAAKVSRLPSAHHLATAVRRRLKAELRRDATPETP